MAKEYKSLLILGHLNHPTLFAILLRLSEILVIFALKVMLSFFSIMSKSNSFPEKPMIAFQNQEPISKFHQKNKLID
jgi:hypothetical protein